LYSGDGGGGGSNSSGNRGDRRNVVYASRADPPVSMPYSHATGTCAWNKVLLSGRQYVRVCVRVWCFFCARYIIVREPCVI